MLDTPAFADVFSRALSWEAYLASAKPGELPAWQRFTELVRLSDEQRALVRSFTRRINVLVISGTWCGDCVQQCPMLHRIAEQLPASADALAPGIDLRFVDRDEHSEFASRFKVCGGMRVPVAIFLNEDFEFVSLLGDKTLSRYRASAARQLGPSCPLPGAPVPPDEIAATLGDWLAEFERVALLLRLSARLRTRHAD